jgi:hypothetical protein
VLFFFFFLKTRAHYIAQVGLKLAILLPQPPECWDYRCAPPSCVLENKYVHRRKKIQLY